MAFKQTILFRADGNAQIGFGHVMRSLALANMLKDNFNCEFATRFLTDFLTSEIKKSCSTIHPLNSDDNSHFDEFLNLLCGHEIVALDNYFFTTEYQKKIKQKGCQLVCIDDLADKHFVADVVINHSPGATNAMYQCEPYTKLCLGLDYVLLREPFLENLKKPKVASDNVSNILISFGGSDNANLTNKVVHEVLQSGFDGKVNVVISSQFAGKSELTAIYNTHLEKLHLFENLSAQQLSDLFSHCQLAIVPCSTLLFEAIASKTKIITGAYVDNQKGIEQFFKSEGSLTIKDFAHETITLSDIQKAKAYQKGFELDVATNHIQQFKRLDLALNVTLRTMAETDLLTVFNWANDPTVRQFAFNPEPISLETHTHWFKAKLKSPQTCMFIMEHHHEPVGQIRFDVQGSISVISYLLDGKYRGMGLGKVLIEKGIESYLKLNPNAVTIVGYVLKQNVASQKAFLACRFNEEFDIEKNALKYSKHYAK